MNSNKDDTSGVIMIFAFVGAGAIMLGALVLALLVFGAILGTVICAVAWDRPLKLGKFALEPNDARAFIYRGFAGAVLAPLFMLFFGVFCGLRINPDYLGYAALIGYAMGSLGWMILNAEEEAAGTTILPPQLPAPPQTPALPARLEQDEPAPRLFRFASWDDEERR